MGKSAAISSAPLGLDLLLNSITKSIKNEGWKWGGKGLGKGSGWDRAGELTFVMRPGKAEGVKSKTTKTN